MKCIAMKRSSTHLTAHTHEYTNTNLLRCRMKANKRASKSTKCVLCMCEYGTHKKCQIRWLALQIQLYRSALWLDFYDFFPRNPDFVWASCRLSPKYWTSCVFILNFGSLLFDDGLFSFSFSADVGLFCCCNATNICKRLRYFVAIVCIQTSFVGSNNERKRDEKERMSNRMELHSRTWIHNEH